MILFAENGKYLMRKQFKGKEFLNKLFKFCKSKLTYYILDAKVVYSGNCLLC